MPCWGFETHTAKRDHKIRCALCGHRVVKGQSVTSWAWKECDGEPPATVKVHEACHTEASRLGVFDDEVFDQGSLSEAMRYDLPANAPFPKCPCGFAAIEKE